MDLDTERPGEHDSLVEPPLPPVIVFALDAHGVCTMSEGPGLARLGVSSGQLVGTSIREWYAGYPQVLERLDRAMSGQCVREIVTVDGVELDTFLQPQFGPNGEVVGAFGTSIDVTETRRHALMLADVARRNRALSDLSAHLADDTRPVGRVLEDATRLVAGLLGGFVGVWTTTETGELSPASYWHRDEEKRGRIPELLSRVDPSTPGNLANAALEHGRPEAMGLTELLGMLPAEADEVRVDAGATDVAHAPIKARGETLGVLAVYREPEHGAFSADELTLLGEFASRIGMALANGRLLSELTMANAELRRAEERARHLAEQRQALLARQVAAVEAERTRIAADVHDDSIQVLAAVDLRLGLLRRRLVDDAPTHVPLLERLQGDVQDAISRLRALLFDLESPARERPLADAVLQLAARAFDGTEVDWTVDDSTIAEPSEAVRTIAYRICQEAIANVRRHSGAYHVRIRLSEEGGGLVLQVSDDGRGLGSQATEPRIGHLGLAGMRERSETAGGHWRIESKPCEGTTMSAWLPLEGPARTNGSRASGRA